MKNKTIRRLALALLFISARTLATDSVEQKQPVQVDAAGNDDSEETGYCDKDADCYEYPYNYCDMSANTCVHKKVFPQHAVEIAGITTFSIIMALCTVAGIGGGGVATSILMAMFFFTTKQAIPISTFSILVCSTMRYIYNLRTPHPEKPNVNLLDYGLASIMMPLTLAGAQFGGIVLDIFPDSVIQMMLFLLLAFLTGLTAKKAWVMHKKEKATSQVQSASEQEMSPVSSVKPKPDKQEILLQQEVDTARHQTETDAIIKTSMEAAATSKDQKLRAGSDALSNSIQSEEISEEESSKKIGADTKVKKRSNSCKDQGAAASAFHLPLKRKPTYTDFDENGVPIVIEGEPTSSDKKIVISDQTFILGRSNKSDAELNRLSKIAKTEAGPAQVTKVLLCVFMIGCVLTMNFLMPTDTYPSPIGISKCSIYYWLVMLGFICICFAVTFAAVYINRSEQKLKIKYQVNYKEGDLVFQGKNLVTLAVIGFFGGLIAGALGLGGGSIYNPAFLSMGVHPKSSGATGMFLVMISTINSVVINYVNGYLEFYWACWISFYALLGSVMGMLVTDWVVKKTGKPSILVWLLVVVFLISSITTPIFGFIQVAQDAEKGRDVWAFANFCS